MSNEQLDWHVWFALKYFGPLSVAQVQRRVELRVGSQVPDLDRIAESVQRLKVSGYLDDENVTYYNAKKGQGDPV